MRFRFILFIILCCWLAACTSRSGQRVAANKKTTTVRMIVEGRTKVVRGKEIFYSAATNTYFELPDIDMLTVDTLYRVGDTLTLDGKTFRILP